VAASEVDEYGITSVVFEAKAPFHPARLWQLLFGTDACLEASAGVYAPMYKEASRHDLALPANLLRSKGFFWVAGLPKVAWEWSTAGPTSKIMVPYGEWMAPRLPRHLWPVGNRLSSKYPCTAAVKNSRALLQFSNIGLTSSPTSRERVFCGSHSDAFEAAGNAPPSIMCQAASRGRLDDHSAAPAVRPGWSPDWGDRKQSLVFIGREMEGQRVMQLIQSCLVTKEEEEQLLMMETCPSEHVEDETHWELLSAPWASLL